MLVDAHFRKVGARMRNTLYGNIPLKGRTSLSPAAGFSVELDFPEDKTELFDARSTFFIIYDNNEKEQKMITENRKEFKKCTGSRLAEITGFEMCGELQFPNATMKPDAPYFPFTGPTSASLVLLKRDAHSGYKMFFKWDKKKQHTVAQFQLNTPGSRVNRLISTDVTLGYQKDKHIDVVLSTPWKKLNMNGKLISNPKVRRMVGTLRMDDEDYGLTTELKREKKNNEYRYTPLVEIIYKGETKTLISGQVICSHPKQRHSLVLDVNGMDKPLVNIEVEARATKDPKRPKTSSLGKLKVKSSLVNVDVSSSTSFEKKLINSRLKVIYDIEGFGRENMRWSGKYSDKSKKSFKQYKMGSTLLFNKYSDYNLQGFLDLHQKRDTKLGLKMNYGKNFKNKNKIVTMNAQFPKSTENWKKPKVYGMMNLKVPEKNWDAGMKVNHLHDKGKIDSSMDIHFLPFMDKGTITAESKLNPNDFSLSAAYTDKTKKVYSLDVLSKMRNLNAGRWSVATKTPSRNVEARAYFRREKEKITGDAVLNWDAGKKKKELSEISLQGSYRNSKVKSGGIMRSSLQLKSPFNKLNNVNLKLNLDQQPKRLKSNGKIFWGGKNDQISVDLVTSFPLSLSQVKVLVAMKSPLKGLRQIELDIDHKLNKDLMTVLRGKMNNAESVIKVQGGGKVNEKMRNLKGEISLKTPYKAYKEMKVTLDHNDDFKKYTTIAGLTHNSKTYKAEFDAVHDSNERDIVNTGKMIITSPVETVETTWNHHIEKETKKLASKITSTSKNKKLINFEASGSYEDINSAQLQIDMTTKWKAFRKGSFQLNHIQNDKLLTTKAIFKRNRDKTGYDLHLINDKDYSDVRLDLFVNPLYKQDISLRSNVKYVSYPMTASAQLEWAPRTKINFDGSLNAPSLDNFDLSSKLTTPFENYKNIHVKSSVKKDSSELIAHLNIDYAIQKMIDVETRYRNDDFMKLLSAKLTSPFTYIQSLDTAIQLETKMEVNAFKADFNLQSINTYGSQINLRKEKADLSGKIQFISPIEGYNFIEANGWLRSKRNAKRTLHLDFKQTPSKDYSLDLSYKTKLPLQLNLNVKTPHPEFDNVGLVFNHDWSRVKIVTHGSITYMSKKTVEVSLNLLVNPKIDGSLIVKTPFESFEHNEVNILYDGKMHDFTSHGSIIVGEEKFSSDLIFKRTSYKTSGDLTLNSPYKIIRGKFMVRGRVQNMRGEALLQYGDKVVKTEFSNIIKKDSLQANFKFTDPDKEEFKFSLEHEDKSTQERRRIQHKQLWSLAKEETKLDATIDHKHYEDSQAEINVISDTLPVFRNVSIKLHRKEDFIDFSGIVDTQTPIVGAIGLIFKTSGPIDKINSLLNLTWHDHSLIEVTVLTNKKSDTEMDGKVTIGGALLPETTSELKVVGDKSSFTSASKFSDKAKFYHEVKYVQDDKITEWDSLMTYDFYTYTRRTDRVYFKRDLSDDLHLITKWLITLEHEKYDTEVFGFDVDHKGNYDKFATSCNLHCGKHGIMKGKLDFFRDGLERVEINAGLTSPFKGIEGQSLKFRFEGQDTRLSGTLNLAHDFNNKEIVTTLLMQNSPHKIFTFSIESPKEGHTYLLLSSELEDGKATVKVTGENETKFSVLAVYSDSIYPYHPHVHLVTPFPWLVKDLTVNLQGHLLDGSADATLLLNENDRVEGKAVLQYDNIFTLTSSVSLDSTFDNLKDLLLELKNTQDPVSKKSILTLALSPENKFSLSGDYLSKEAFSTSKIDKQLLLDIKLPLDEVHSMSLTLGLQADIDKVDGQMGFDLNLEKVLDMDLNYDIVDKKSVSLTVRKPRAMEYSLSQNENGDLIENDVYLNWNRDEPESNIHIKSTYKDLSDSRKTDRAASLSLIHPARSIGIEHSQLSSSRNVVSAGKLFWNTDDSSRLFYNLNLNDKSGRRFTFMDGEFIFGVPMRTLGVSGNFRKNTGKQSSESDVSFSWDLDNDKSKKISLNTKVSGDEEVNADISLKLPAEVQVDSKLILNKGNTIFDGKTDISYSWDDRKTLTLTSKLENNPATYSLFSSPNGYNYSIQFGIRHPDTKVDMNLKSHVGQNDELLTSSLGLDYLTSYRQKKNIALWLEIDKLKKQINLISTNPYKNLGVTGKVLSEEPLKLQAVATTDDEENLKATLDVDYALNKLRLGLGNPDKVVHLTALYPNKSAFQVDIQHSLSTESHEDAAVTMRLATPRLIMTDLTWRPEMIEEAQSFLIQMISQGNDELKTLLSELSLDVEKEITRKYKDLTSALSDDTKPLIDFVRQEMKIILQQINTFERKWNRAVRNNDLYLADIVTTVNRILESASLELIDIQEMSKASIRSLMKPLNSLSEQMVALKNYPMRPTYRKVVNKMIETSTKKMDEMVQSLTESILDINNQISNLKELSKVFVENSAQNLANHPWVEALTERLQLFKTFDVSPQLQKVMTLLKDLIVEHESVKMLQEGSNEIYQQAKWAYNYWEIEENLPKLLQSLLITLQEVGEEEIAESLRHLVPYLQNPVIVFDPETGLLKMAFILPFDVERLDEMPNLTKVMEDPTNALRRYIIDLGQYWAESNETTDSRPSSEKDYNIDFASYKTDDSEQRW